MSRSKTLLSLVVGPQAGNRSQERKAAAAPVREQVDLQELHALMQVRKDESRHRASGRNRIPECQFLETAIQFLELAARAARGHCFGRFRCREEIGVKPREHHPVGDVLVVLDLDPDRLDQLVRQRRSVHGGALVGRQCRRGNTHLTLRPGPGARDVCSLAARVLRGGGRAAERPDSHHTGDDDPLNSRVHR